MNNRIINNFTKVLAVGLLIAPAMGIQTNTVGAQSKNSSQNLSERNSFDRDDQQEAQNNSEFNPKVIDKVNQGIRIENNQYVLDSAAKNELSQSEIVKIDKLLQEFNAVVKEKGIILTQNDAEDESSDTSLPFISLIKKHRSRHHYKAHIVGYGSNGYCYEDSRGHFHYYVTKTPMQTVASVLGHGWGNAAGSGFGLGLIGH